MPNLTTAEVVLRHGVSRRTVRRKVESGELPVAAKFPTKTGGYLFDAEVVDRVFATPASDNELEKQLA